MQPYSIWHRIAIIVSVLSLLTITYITILINNFKTPEATTDFLKNSNTYSYIAEIIKANIRSHYTQHLKGNVVELAVADNILNTVINPNVIERIAFPLLRLRQRVAQLPLSFVQNNLALDTKQYTQQASQTIASLNLPTTFSDAANNLLSSVPSQITIVDTQKNPNSILVSITKTRILFENLQTILTISWIVFIIALFVLLIVNRELLKRLIYGLFLIFLISGVVGLLASYVVPAIASWASSNPDPIAGVLKDEMVDSIVWYYFSLTRNPYLIYIIVAIGLYLIHHFVPMPQVQKWIDVHILRQPASLSDKKTPRKKQR